MALEVEKRIRELQILIDTYTKTLAALGSDAIRSNRFKNLLEQINNSYAEYITLYEEYSKVNDD